MIQHVYGVEMEVPGGKLPGFYAQVVHKIGDQVDVFDREARLFVVTDENERDKLVQILQTHGMLGEMFDLLLLPEGIESSSVSDYGFTSLKERAYLYADQVAVFRFGNRDDSGEDRWAALEQMREYIIADTSGISETSAVYCVDREQAELMERIAAAYKVQIEWEWR